MIGNYNNIGKKNEYQLKLLQLYENSLYAYILTLSLMILIVTFITCRYCRIRNRRFQQRVTFV
jgi:ABC-type maltose transport system permease subunit